MASPPPMSTPVQNLPPAQAVQPVEDPALRDVLKEMDAEVAAAAAANRQTAQPQQMQSQHLQQMFQPPIPPAFHPMMFNQPQGFQMDLAKRALIAAVIAGLLFHPMLADMLEQRMPMLSNEIYMGIARVLLLSVVFYVLMWKLDI